jgi:hypothetical protein
MGRECSKRGREGIIIVRVKLEELNGDGRKLVSKLFLRRHNMKM